jgi:hypothetical protein
MKGMRAFIFVVAVACAACSAPADITGVTEPVAANADQDAAMAMAKSCIDKNGYSTVWHTALVTEKITATHVRDRVWVVGGPESGVDKDGKPVLLGLPSGLMVSVDLDAKSCRQLMLE